MGAMNAINNLEYTVGRQTEAKDIRVISSLPLKLARDRNYHIEVKNDSEVHIYSTAGIQEFNVTNADSNITLTNSGVTIKHERKTIHLHREARRDFPDVILPEEVGIADDLARLAASNDPAEKRKILASLKQQIIKENVRTQESSYTPSSESRASISRSGG